MEPDEIILLLHGIRTHAEWQSMVKRVLEEIPGKHVEESSHGYFDVFRFWCPFVTRASAIDEVRETIEQLRIRFPNSKLSVIAHSNGTYIISKLLLSKRDLQIDKLVLCGSIVKRRYPWDFVEGRLGADVVNEYGTKDIWPVLAKALSWGYGDTGRYRFGKPHVLDRKHDCAHSDYFGDKEGQGEDFVRKFWKPWFEDGTFVPSESSGRSPFWLSLLSIAPIQWTVLALVLLFGILSARHALLPNVPPIRAVLADTLNVPEDRLVVNFPPASGRYPSSVMAKLPSRELISFRTTGRPESVPPITWQATGEVGELGAQWLSGGQFGLTPDQSKMVYLEMELSEGRVYEIDARTLRKINSESQVASARERGASLVFVHRAYEAVPTIRLSRWKCGEAEWMSIRERLAESSATQLGESDFELRADEPVVIAFETVSVKEISQHMGSGEAELQTIANYYPSDGEDILAPRDNRIAHHVVFADEYVSDDFGDLPSARTSAILVDQVLAAHGSISLGTVREQPPFQTGQELLKSLNDAIESAESRGCEALIFYINSHAIAVDNGVQYIVTNEFRGDLPEVLRKAKEYSASIDPLILSVLDQADVAERYQAGSVAGAVRLRELHDMAAESEVHVAILLDGCCSVDTFEMLRDSLSLTEFGDYYGRKNFIFEEIERYEGALEVYGNAPYLNTDTVVMLSARPGSIAYVQADPRESWRLTPKIPTGVGPFASRLLTLREAQEFGLEVESWGHLLRLTLDKLKGVGENKTTGSISWSDLSAFDRLKFAR